MTKQEYLTAEAELLSQKADIERKISELKDNYKTFALFQVGDKVKVYKNDIFLGYAFVASINCSDYGQSNGDYTYTINKEKKDGTPSKQEWWFGFTHFTQIKKNT